MNNELLEQELRLQNTKLSYENNLLRKFGNKLDLYRLAKIEEAFDSAKDIREVILVHLGVVSMLVESPVIEPLSLPTYVYGNRAQKN